MPICKSKPAKQPGAGRRSRGEVGRKHGGCLLDSEARAPVREWLGATRVCVVETKHRTRVLL